LRPAGGLVGTNVHEAGAVSCVGVILSGVRLFLVSMSLNVTRSALNIVFHVFMVDVNSLQPDSHVSICALLGGISIPFCANDARTVLKIPLIE
jgi:hypothetical protein